ncbi:MAG: GNAT family N-acetyltransferase, partial [Planctomycetota bacterium]
VAMLVEGTAEARAEHARRFMRFAEQNEVDLGAMWSRLDARGRTVATVLAVPNAGATAMIFATPPRRRSHVPGLAELIDHACVQLERGSADAGNVHLVQVLVDPDHELERELFLASGFRHLARLSYLQRPLPGPRLPRSEGWPEDVRLHVYDESRRDDLLEILDASYEQTLDCPGLLGLRRTVDVLRGHQATGEFDPNLWTLMDVGGRPGGALLLNPSSQGGCIELVYLGLATFARGRGLGRRLLRHGIQLVRHRRERTITLAVDDNNSPALHVYQTEGFKRRLRRIALIRPLGHPGC